MSHQMTWRRFLASFGIRLQSTHHREAPAAPAEAAHEEHHDLALMAHVAAWQREIAESVRELVLDVEGEPDERIERIAVELEARRRQAAQDARDRASTEGTTGA